MSKSQNKLADFPAAYIIGELYQSKKTGKLVVAGKEWERVIHFLDGDITFVESTNPDEQLSTIIAEKSKLSTKQSKRFEKLLRKKGADKFGELFIKEGIIEEHELGRWMTRLIRTVVSNAIQMQQGTFQFLPEESSGLTKKFTTPAILASGIRATSSLRHLSRYMPENDVIPILKPDAEQSIALLGLNYQEKRVLTYFNGRSTIADIMESSGLKEKEILVSLHACLALGLIETKKKKPSLDSSAKPSSRERSQRIADEILAEMNQEAAASRDDDITLGKDTASQKRTSSTKKSGVWTNPPPYASPFQSRATPIPRGKRTDIEQKTPSQKMWRDSSEFPIPTQDEDKFSDGPFDSFSIDQVIAQYQSEKLDGLVEITHDDKVAALLFIKGKLHLVFVKEKGWDPRIVLANLKKIREDVLMLTGKTVEALLEVLKWQDGQTKVHAFGESKPQQPEPKEEPKAPHKASSPKISSSTKRKPIELDAQIPLDIKHPTDFTEMPVPMLLYHLSREKWTGVLEIVSETETVGLFYHQGKLHYGILNSPGWELSAILSNMGYLNKDTIEAKTIKHITEITELEKSLTTTVEVQNILENLRKLQIKLLETLIDEGWMNLEDVQAVIQDYLRKIIAKVIEWDSGEYHYRQEPDDDSVIFPVILNLEEYLFITTLEQGNLGRHGGFRDVVPKPDEIFAPVKGCRNRMIYDRFNLKQRKFLERIDGWTTVRELIIGEENYEKAITLLVALICMDMVRKTKVSGVTDRASSPDVSLDTHPQRVPSEGLTLSELVINKQTFGDIHRNIILRGAKVILPESTFSYSGQQGILVFHELIRSNHSGVLVMRHDEYACAYNFRAGKVNLAVSNHPDDRFGKYLLTHKLIDRSKVSKEVLMHIGQMRNFDKETAEGELTLDSISKQSAYQVKLGELMLKAEALSIQDLHTSLTEFLKRIVFRTFLEKNAYCETHGVELELDSSATFDLGQSQLIAEGAKVIKKGSFGED